MVETSSVKFDGKHCPDCLKELESSLVEKAFNPEVNAFCPFCGNLLEFVKEEDDISSPQLEREEISIPPKKPILDKRMALKIHVHLLIHQLLSQKPVLAFRIRCDKPLRDLHLKRYAHQLRSHLLKKSISSQVFRSLSNLERKGLRKALEDFKTLISDKKAFKQQHRSSFIEGIGFMYELMRGSFELTDLSAIEQQIVSALKEDIDFYSDLKAKNSPYRKISMFYARIIHQRVFALFRTSEGGQLPPNAIQDLVDELVDRLKNKGFARWLEKQVNVKLSRRMKKNFSNFRYFLRFDWLDREMTFDHLTAIAQVIHDYLLGGGGQLATNGLGRIILQGLAESELFRFDPAFSPNEKLNLTIVLARMVRAKLDATFPPVQDDTIVQALPKSVQREITKEMVKGLSSELPISPHFLLRFYNFSLDKYHAALFRLREKLTSDPIYRASFRLFIFSLVETVFTLTRNCPKKSKLTALEMRVREDLELYPYDWRIPEPRLFLQQETDEPSEMPDEQETQPEIEEIPKMPELPVQVKEEFQDIFTREIADDDPLWRVRAYIIGFLLADGTIRTGPYELAAAQNSQDQDILYKINKALGGKVEGPDDEDKYHLHIYQKDFVLKLKDFGMIEAHSIKDVAKNIVPPDFIKKIIENKTLVRDFTRGFYDGDGWITGSFKRGDTSFRILGPLKFLNILKKLISSEIPDISSFIVAERKQYFIYNDLKFRLYSKQKIYIKGQGFVELTEEDLEKGEIIIQDHPWLKILIFGGNYNCTRFFNWMYDNDDEFERKIIGGFQICGERKFNKALEILGNSKERKERLAPDWKDCVVDSISKLQKRFYSAMEIMNLTNKILKAKLNRLGLDYIYNKQSAKNLDKFRDYLKFYEFLDNIIGRYRKGNRNLYYSEQNKPRDVPNGFKRNIDLISNSRINKNIKSLIIYLLFEDPSLNFEEIYKKLRNSSIFSRNVLYRKNVKLNIAELISFNLIIADNIESDLEEQSFTINKNTLSKLVGNNINEIKSELYEIYEKNIKKK